MTSLLHLNKTIIFTVLFTILFNSAFASTAVDIWKDKENQNEQTNNEKEIIIKSPILSDDANKIPTEIDEQKINDSGQAVIGIFDPEENNFNLSMWSNSDGDDIQNILGRINKLNLSKFSQDLLFQVLFTNAYPPKTNLNSSEFLKIKIDWLINNQKFQDLETLLKKNPEVGYETKAVKFLINEYLSSANIKSACEGVNFINKDVQNNYLDKFIIYCLINEDRKEEAQLILDLLKERGFKDKFFEDKIDFLLGYTEKTNQEISDKNLLNFYLSHITSSNFKYEPNDKTDEYIWRYLSSANLIQISDLENEDEILTYEQAAAEGAFENDEVFKIYLKIDFSFNQLMNAAEIYKNLSNFKARALIYQSILLSDKTERKLNLAFLLKDLFSYDELSNVYTEELTDILRAIDPNEIPESYRELVEKNLDQNLLKTKRIAFDNDILHRSKVLKHFLDNNEKLNRTEKDFKTVYKKIKKNKKYFYSIKDFIVLESLRADGVQGVPLRKDIKNRKLALQLAIPDNLLALVDQNQMGLVMLKIIEIIGEDDIRDLDPETIYFINGILNKMNLKKIRNKILSETLPVRI